MASCSQIRDIILGSETPSAWVKPREKQHTFRWTGSKGDTEYKSPGSLVINRLRLQDTQTYQAIKVRTKDNVVIEVSMMLSFGFEKGNIGKLLENDDPFGSMFNQIMADIVALVGTLSFDEFKDDPNKRIASLPLFTNGTFFSNLGLTFIGIIVKNWFPVDNEIQRILSRAGVLQTQKELDQAEHDRKMAGYNNERIQIEESQKLTELRRQSAVDEGRTEAERMVAFINALEPVAGKTSKTLAMLSLVKGVNELHLSPEMFKG